MLPDEIIDLIASYAGPSSVYNLSLMFPFLRSYVDDYIQKIKFTHIMIPNCCNYHLIIDDIVYNGITVFNKTAKSILSSIRYGENLVTLNRRNVLETLPLDEIEVYVDYGLVETNGDIYHIMKGEIIELGKGILINDSMALIDRKIYNIYSNLRHIIPADIDISYIGYKNTRIICVDKREPTVLITLSWDMSGIDNKYDWEQPVRIFGKYIVLDENTMPDEYPPDDNIARILGDHEHGYVYISDTGDIKLVNYDKEYVLVNIFSEPMFDISVM